MTETIEFPKNPKGKIIIPIAIILLTAWIIYQQYFKHYIVGINGWGLGFCAMLPYLIFESMEQFGGKSSDRFAALKIICGFIIFISFLMIVFEWKTDNLNFFFWFLIFASIGFFAFVIINAIDDSPVTTNESLLADELYDEDEFNDEDELLDAAEDLDIENDYSKINAALAADNRFPQGATGKSAKFNYKSRDGNLNDWRITDWVATDIMIQGKKINSNEFRTFRKDKIMNWVSE